MLHWFWSVPVHRRASRFLQRVLMPVSLDLGGAPPVGREQAFVVVLLLVTGCCAWRDPVTVPKRSSAPTKQLLCLVRGRRAPSSSVSPTSSSRSQSAQAMTGPEPHSNGHVAEQQRPAPAAESNGAAHTSGSSSTSSAGSSHAARSGAGAGAHKPMLPGSPAPLAYILIRWLFRFGA